LLQEAITHPFLARVRAARHTVSELPAPRRFRMHSQLNKLKSAEVRALFISRLCGDYTPDHDSAPAELFPAAAAAERRRRGEPEPSSSSRGSRAPMSSPAPRRRPPAMQDGMFVKGAGQAGAEAGEATAGEVAEEDDDQDDEDEEEDEFADAQDMEGGAPEWLTEEGSGSAGRAVGSSSSGVGGFVNASDAGDEEDEEDEGEGAYAYGGGGGGSSDLDGGEAYWGASSRDGGAGALAAELLAEQEAMADGHGRAAAAAAAAAASVSSSSSSSSEALHAVVGRSSGSTLVRLPAHTQSALGAGDSTAISSGDYESSAGRAHPGRGGAIAGRRAGRGSSHLAISAESKPAPASEAVAFVSPAGGLGSGVEEGPGYRRSVSPIATPDEDEFGGGSGSASAGRRFHGSAGTSSRPHGIHRQKPATGAPAGSTTSSGSVAGVGGRGGAGGSAAHRAVQRGIPPASDEASHLDERLFAAASRTGTRGPLRATGSAASTASSGTAIPTRALPQPSASSSSSSSASSSLAVAGAAGARPLSRGGVATLSSVTPPRQQQQRGAAPGSAHSLSVTPGSRRSATTGSAGPASSSGAGRASGSGFTPDRGTSDTSQRSGGRSRRTRSSLEYAGAQAAVTSTRPSARQ
jgi:hypothetical protein